MLIASVSNQGSGKFAHMSRLASAFSARIHKIMNVNESSNYIFRPLASLTDMAAWACVGGICAYAMNAKISCAGSYSQTCNVPVSATSFFLRYILNASKNATFTV